jgi:hypothetical protein
VTQVSEFNAKLEAAGAWVFGMGLRPESAPGSGWMSRSHTTAQKRSGPGSRPADWAPWQRWYA